jgi:guanosine-3',5'-bis(diphosphate) 3'-pyrophosphohydrolase
MADSIIAAAATLARRAHEGQERKYTGEPYFNHCCEVQSILAVIRPSPDMSAAALLHDVLEDTDTTFDEIVAACGINVARIVQELTDAEKGSRAERVAQSIKRLSEASPEAQTIKCCDLISNTSSIMQHDRNFSKVYLREKRLTLAVLTKAHPFLRAQAQTTLMAAEAFYVALPHLQDKGIRDA